MEIKVKGNSGCSLEITSYKGFLGIKKASQDEDYAARLKTQINKQKKASIDFESLPFIHIPEIWHEHEEINQGKCISYSATMEYLHFQSYLDFFLKASLDKLNIVIENIISVVELQLKKSHIELIDNRLILNKLDEIEQKIADSNLFETKKKQLDKLREKTEHTKLLLPVGPTHGDLTLANMMISSDGAKIGIFDFLDSYIESPLLDIAKLRQDTQFHWSRLMTPDFTDAPRYKMVMAYIDQAIDVYFSRYEWYKGYYNLIQGVNIARIFPYEKSSQVTEFTTSTISKLGY